MREVAFTIPGDPIAKARPRVTRGGHTYTPKRTADAEEVVRQIARSLNMEPFAVPVGMEVHFFCKTKRRTDGDNLLKMVQDACNEIVYTDDYLIEEWKVCLHRSPAGEEPRTEVLFYELEAGRDTANCLLDSKFWNTLLDR